MTSSNKIPDKVQEVRMAMETGWDKVVELYKSDHETHRTKISMSGYTALHVAVAEGKSYIVEKLVESIKDKRNQSFESYKALHIQNKYGNTPLHLAASMGNVRMCEIMISAEDKVARLMKIENEEGETPIFLAALHGKKDVFLYLNCVLRKNIQVLEEAMRTCRRDNGDTILHSAINGEYFDLAYQIICKYTDMANAVNDEGKTPLQILATKPSAFKSASKFGLWKRIIYACISVQKLKEDLKSYKTSSASLKDGDHQQQPLDKNHGPVPEKEDKNYPENYTTLIGCYSLVRNLARLVVTRDPAKDFCGDEETAEGNQISSNEDKTLYPENYTVFFYFLKLLLSALLVLTGKGHEWMIKMQKLKEKHIWSVQVLDELIKHNTKYDYEDAGASPYLANEKEYVDELLGAIKPAEDHENLDHKTESGKRETALLIASRNGIIEMIKRILKKFPMAIYDTNKDGKNIVLVALETRQVEVFKLIMKTHAENESVFRKVDNDGNGALHIAAMGGEKPVSWPIPDDALQLKWKILPNKTHADNIQSVFSKVDNKDNGALHIAAVKGDLQKQHRWPIPGDALQLQWEIKWFKFVESAKPENFFVRYNKNEETPEEIFTKDHQKLVESGGQWMTKTAESCSVIAALIATVAFATSATLPGGTHEGKPVFAKQPAFQVFAVMSLVALSFSVTSLVMFLAILTSRFTQKDFDQVLPWKLLLGLTSLFVSIATILVSFCAGHFFVLKDSVEVAAFPVYAFTCIPISFFAAAQFPLYIDLIRATFGNPFAINEEISITLSNRYV